ncbi:hypothetical protein EG328_011083 [Venturia inaequalis]|uniref:Up-regulated during septation protein 1 domain-containing protein n=1 Tax=Venturia inaequalis TaxID=5025 RepID=A0A8H3V4W4_VENIN|nr:hypothetical protein EG328_011083 [Venturia inaequalis]KAE9984234.1 hypothetical protein EG327_005090 [Venturia inaequalis]
MSLCSLLTSKDQNLTADQRGLDIFEQQSPHRASFKGEQPTGYQTWPRPPSRAAPCPLGLAPYVDQKSMALAAGRSPTSLSDTVLAQDIPLSWHLGGSLSRRRNISVPELTQKIDQSTRITYQESFADSPTIPGRPALRKVASEMLHHERSISVPGNWRDCPISDAMVTGVARPDFAKPPSIHRATPMRENSAAFHPTRPLSPIFSPAECNTPTTSVARSPVSPIGAPDVPPKVPPKTTIDGGSPAPKSDIRRKPSRGWLGACSTKQSLKIDASLPPLARNASYSIMNESALPNGMRPMEAMLILSNAEKEILREQAAGQAQQFEVLGARHVNDLSRELRALDERCEYLRRTYKSLRSSRQKLHTRMLSYLKSENLTFSKERLLKQQEALMELDKSIDDWILKLERAENRRLRLRQKLLEHVAAAMALGPEPQYEYPPAPSYPAPQCPQAVHIPQTTTPPRSPKMSPMSPPHTSPVVESPEPLRLGRKEVESIKVYADHQVLNLFSDIEQAVTKMCEAC